MTNATLTTLGKALDAIWSEYGNGSNSRYELLIRELQNIIEEQIELRRQIIKEMK